MKIADVERRARELIEENLDALKVAEEVENGEWSMDEGKHRSLYLGTVMSIFPSGKFYTPWANSNVDPCPRCKGSGNGKMVPCSRCHDGWRDIPLIEDAKDFPEIQCWVCGGKGTQHMPCSHCGGMGSREAYEDERFREMMDTVANEHGVWVESGEGDFCDLFLCCAVEEGSDTTKEEES
jgi:hypothetical protein